MSKFRARQLDASKPISIYLQEDITDFTDYNNVTNRTVPQLPTGMEKEEETEHHLQQAIFHQQVIPVPEVYDTTKTPDGCECFERLYPPTYKITKQMIHIHPFSAEQDIPDYDLDSEDEEWLHEHANKGELLPLDALQFEEMMDRLEKASGLKAVTLQEAKLLLKDDDDLITAVFDYWLNKRLRLQHPLIPQVRKMTLTSQVKNEKCAGAAPTDPYVAFRKRTEKMQTRKNRKNDESSYEKMLKLRRDLTKAVTLLEMVKRREKSKRELLHLTIEIFEKRNEMEDFSGAIFNEIAAQRLQMYSQRPVFSSLLTNHQLNSSSINMSENDDASMDHSDLGSHVSWRLKSNINKVRRKEEGKRERKPHKKRRRQTYLQVNASSPVITQSYTHPPDVFTIASPFPQDGLPCIGASEDEMASATSASHSEAEEEANIDGPFAFRRKPFVTYHAPCFLNPQEEGGPSHKGGEGGPHKNFSLASISQPVKRFIGFARRRVGRGGRIWLDRSSNHWEESRLKSDIENYAIKCDKKETGLFGSPSLMNSAIDHKKEWPHFHPTSQLDSSEDSEDVEVDVETVSGVPSLSFHSPSRMDALSFASNPSYSKENGGLSDHSLPSSFYITAEITDGSNKGTFTNLQVSLPPPSEDLEHLFMSETVGNDSLLLEDNNLEEVDILSTECGGNSVPETSRTHTNAKITQIVTSQSDLLTSGNSVISDNHSGDSSLSNSENYIGTNGSGARLTFSSVCGNSVHSNLEFQTQPSSKFTTSDNTNTLSATQVVNKQNNCPSISNTTEEPPGCPPHTSSSLNSSSHSFYNTVVKNFSGEASSSTSSSASSSCSSPSSISLSLPTTIVSSSLATSLSNSLSCASQKSQDGTPSQETNSKKLPNHSSIFLNRQPKDNNLPFHSLQVSSSLLSNNKNGNSLLNSSTNLVPQKIISSWTGENSGSDDTITNGPSNKSIGKPKCAKVTQIIFHES